MRGRGLCTTVRAAMTWQRFLMRGTGRRGAGWWWIPGLPFWWLLWADDVVGVITLDANGVFPTNAPDETRVRLVGIFVEPDRWSSGVGSALMGHFVSVARQADAVGEVDVWERNSRAIRFYERHGWTRDGTSRPGPAGADYVGFVHLP